MHALNTPAFDVILVASDATPVQQSSYVYTTMHVYSTMHVTSLNVSDWHTIHS